MLTIGAPDFKYKRSQDSRIISMAAILLIGLASCICQFWFYPIFFGWKLWYLFAGFAGSVIALVLIVLSVKKIREARREHARSLKQIEESRLTAAKREEKKKQDEEKYRKDLEAYEKMYVEITNDQRQNFNKLMAWVGLDKEIISKDRKKWPTGAFAKSSLTDLIDNVSEMKKKITWNGGLYNTGVSILGEIAKDSYDDAVLTEILRQVEEIRNFHPGFEGHLALVEVIEGAQNFKDLFKRIKENN